MIPETDRAYIAGLFDGEGSIMMKRGLEKKKRHNNKEGYRMSNSMRINMEITMTDKSVLKWLHEAVGVGTLRPKIVKGLRKDGTPYLKQWKWRCVFRDAYYVCLLIWPWSHTKLLKIQKIIEYYDDKKIMNGKVVNLKEYKEAMSLE